MLFHIFGNLLAVKTRICFIESTKVSTTSAATHSCLMSQDISAINNALNDIERESDEEDGNDGHRAESNSDQVAAVAAALVEAVDSLNIDLPMTPQSQGRTPSSGSSASGGFEKVPTAMKRKPR
jgi:hypothetical protein